MLHRVLLHSKLSVVYSSGTRCVQEIWQPCERKKYALPQEMLHPRRFKVQLYLDALLYLEGCMQKKLLSSLGD